MTLDQTLRSLFLALVLPLALTATATGCSSTTSDDEEAIEGTEDPLTRVSDGELTAAQAADLGDLTFEELTPTGTNIMRAAHYWMNAQDEDARYPKARMCASNVSKVLFLSGIRRYDQQGVRNLISDVGRGGQSFQMPQTKAAFIAKLNTIYGGHIPAGTVLAGMNVHTSNPGDQHVGFIGHVDPDGTVWAYHNNWYRPENEGGRRKDFMISEDNLRRGFPRQWMATPWIRITRDANGAITDVKSSLPALDDLDPFNPSYQVTLTIPQEIVQELP
jgi:hypothetical protein